MYSSKMVHGTIRFLLHIHASVSEYVDELIFENLDDRNALLLVSIT
jgi:glycerol-3-phosphate dehydrogenase